MAAPPLGVRLVNARYPAGFHVGAELRHLSFRSAIPGGFDFAEARLDRPLDRAAAEIALLTDFLVYDRRSAEVAWQGELDDPGRAASAAGQVWTLQARGPAQLAGMRTVYLYYADRSLERFARRSQGTETAAQIEVTDDASGVAPVPQILLRCPRGTVAAANWIAGLEHRGLRVAGQKLARIGYTAHADITDTNWFLSVVTRSTGGGTEVSAHSFASGAVTSSRVVGTHFANGHDLVELRIIRKNTSQTVASDNTHGRFYSVSVRSLLLDRSGAEITTGYTQNYVVAQEVVEDLLGRLLGDMYDGPSASIAPGTVQIDQLAYPDGTTAAKVLLDLMSLEEDSRWAAWEKLRTGRYRFVWDYWTDEPRYVAREYDEFDGPSAAADLFSSVLVRYRDPDGFVTSTVRVQDVPIAELGGRTQQGFLDLSDEAGSLALANAAGDVFLAAHRSTPNAGRLVVSGRLWDRAKGRPVDPWLVRPGSLVEVPGIVPRPDRLNKMGRDGQTVFRLVSTDYSTPPSRVSLELDNSPVATSEQIAALRREFAHRRRR